MPGRFEVLRREPLVVVDGAHNPDGAATAAATFAADFAPLGGTILVVGMMADKDPTEMLTALSAHRASVVIATAPPWGRALPAEDLAAAARRLSIDVEAVSAPDAAVERAMALATEDDAILVVGSLYLVEAAREVVAAS